MSVAPTQCGTPSGQVSRNQLPYGVSVKIGYVAISGTRALVGFTGKICSPGALPECTVNTNPGALFSAGNIFAVLWEQTANPNRDISSYTLLPCSEVGGKWYVGPRPRPSVSAS